MPGSVPRSDPRGDVLDPLTARLRGTVLVLRARAGAAGRCAPGASVTVTADGADLPPPARFDAVVLDDLLPAARGGSGGGDRLAATIAWGRDRLRAGGRLILATGNALSLHGLAAGAEAPGRPGLPSLEGRIGPDGVQLPTRRSLERSLRACGLVHQEWWFVFPDRDRPLGLVSAHALARPGGFDPAALVVCATPPAPPGPRAIPFALRNAWARAADQDLAGDLAPAFAVTASDAPLPEDERLALYLGLRRRPEFERLVTFVATGGGIAVRRTRLNPGLPAQVEGVSNLFPSEPFIPGPLWSAVLDARCARDGWCPDAVAAWATVWRDAVARDFAAGAVLEPGTVLPAPALDAIPKNLVAGADHAFIDLEWDLGAPLDAGHLVLRGLVNALTDVPAWGRPASASPLSNLLEAVRVLLPRLGLAMDDAQLAERLARESRFQSIVSGRATRRDLGWAAATALSDAPGPAAAPARDGPPADPAAEIARLREENEALRAARAVDAANHAAAALESARRTDRVIAHAAGLHRAHDRLQETLAARDALWARRGGRLPARLRRLLGGTP